MIDRRTLCTLLALYPLTIWAKPMRCDVCGKPISGRYQTTADGRIFCSTACFQSILPKCKLCHKPIESGFTIKNQTYCEECTKKSAHCFSCNQPAKYVTTLDDGRQICTTCMRWAVKTQEQAIQYYDRARRQLEAWTSIPIKSLPTLVLVDANEMKTLSKKLRKTEASVSLRGLYSRQITTWKYKGIAKFFKKDEQTEQEKIYIVDHLHDEVFRVAAVHELMHDLIHENFPHIEQGPLWLQEGICQYAAADFCRRKVYTDNLYAIEHAPDPDYGDGYRYVANVVGLQGWRGLRKWMESLDVSTLPEKAPTQ